jgi:riboflavin kinase/FMN adenylyltransferase
MRILSIDDSLPAGETAVLTVGNFDGVHRGHRALLDTVVRRALETGRRSVAVTFEPHTRLAAVGPAVQGSGDHELLTTFEEKARLLELEGLDYLVKVPFDAAFSRKTPEEFIGEILSAKLRLKEWVLGHGHAVGRNRSGDENFLQSMEGKYHFKTFIADLYSVEGVAVSSTQIRELITSGRIADAVERLGHPYLFSVERTRGIQLGTTLGYPTLNFKTPPLRKVLSPAGVYVAELEFEGSIEQGALYFGGCPTFGGNREVHFEFYSFSRGTKEIPVGSRADIWVHAFIRPDRVFSGPAELTGQIKDDVERIKTYFTKENKQWR